MNTSPLRLVLTAPVLAFLLVANPVLATCGGGGGGGAGGAVPGGGMGGGDAPQVYYVPWKVYGPNNALPKAPEASLVVMWFPKSVQSARKSPLLISRPLSLAGARCVADALITSDNTGVRGKFSVGPADEAVIVIAADGTEIGRVVPSSDGKMPLNAVEKLLNTELSTREKALDAALKAADKRVAEKDKTVVPEIQAVWEQRCLFPNLGKRAAKMLSKLGVKVEQAALDRLGPEGLADPDFVGFHADVERVLATGLVAERAGRFAEAEKFYRQATEIDPADPTALRFLAELYRHQTGEWDLARDMFQRVLAQPADAVSRAVALHGLGKMTIHGGHFAEGLAMFDQSLAEFPLPITYRNLAVYWFSEKQVEVAAGYMRQAIALDPEDRYNQIFAAVYLAAAGKKEEAAKIARDNEAVLEASYNLAAIWAQVGDRTKALELLHRHFYDYEQYDAVRSKEMEEARSDYAFADLKNDPAFLELTKLAKRAIM